MSHCRDRIVGTPFLLAYATSGRDLSLQIITCHFIQIIMFLYFTQVFPTWDKKTDVSRETSVILYRRRDAWSEGSFLLGYASKKSCFYASSSLSFIAFATLTTTSGFFKLTTVIPWVFLPWIDIWDTFIFMVLPWDVIQTRSSASLTD